MDPVISGDQNTLLIRPRSVVKSSDLIDNTRQEAIYSLRVERVGGVGGVFHVDDTIVAVLGCQAKRDLIVVCGGEWVIAYIVAVLQLGCPLLAIATAGESIRMRAYLQVVPSSCSFFLRGSRHCFRY